MPKLINLVAQTCYTLSIGDQNQFTSHNYTLTLRCCVWCPTQLLLSKFCQAICYAIVGWDCPEPRCLSDGPNFMKMLNRNVIMLDKMSLLSNKVGHQSQCKNLTSFLMRNLFLLNNTLCAYRYFEIWSRAQIHKAVKQKVDFYLVTQAIFF